MLKKIFSAGIMLAVLIGGAFAFFGHGMGFAGKGDNALSDEARFELMSARHNGDWDAFSTTAQKYGLEIKEDEESFKLRARMNSALATGDYSEFLAIKEQMPQKTRNFGEMHKQGFMRNKVARGECPYAQSG